MDDPFVIKAKYYLRVRRDCLRQVRHMENLLKRLSKERGFIINYDNDFVFKSDNHNKKYKENGGREG